MHTLRRDGVLRAAWRIGLAAVAARALQRVSAGAVDVQLEATGQNPGQLLMGLPVLLQGATRTCIDTHTHTHTMLVLLITSHLSRHFEFKVEV